MATRLSPLASLAILVALLALSQCAAATSWSSFDTPFHNSNSTEGPISYTPDCALCPSACTGAGTCCGGYISNSTGYPNYMCADSCLPSDRVCCGCNDPEPGQLADPNLLCVSCHKDEKCYYKPSTSTNIRYYCVSSASFMNFSVLLLVMVGLVAVLL